MTEVFTREVGAPSTGSADSSLATGTGWSDHAGIPEYLRAEDLALVRRHGSRLLAIRRAGYDAFSDLSNATPIPSGTYADRRVAREGDVSILVSISSLRLGSAAANRAHRQCLKRSVPPKSEPKDCRC